LRIVFLEFDFPGKFFDGKMESGGRVDLISHSEVAFGIKRMSL
jgi:hypothetical protein